VVLLLLVGGEVRLVAKIARLAGDEGPRNEGRILEALAVAGIPVGAAPRFVAGAEVAGHAVLVEEALHGRPLDRRLVRTDPARWIAAVVEWLADLPRGAPGTSASLDELVRRPLLRVRDAHPEDGDLGRLVDRTLSALGPLASPGLPGVFEHGDLSHPNLLVRPDGRLGVLDWELGRRDGLPLHDLCFYLEYVARATGGEAGDPFDRLERVLAHPTWGAAAALRSEAARLGVDRSRLPALMAVCWARAFAREAELGSAQRPGSLTGRPASSRYYRLWEGAVDREAQLRDLLV
jgi:aminoglycoside phosphotransferase (APT) family kinase protein